MAEKRGDGATSGPGDGDLERYGVWVKAEPQDIAEAPLDDSSVEEIPVRSAGAEDVFFSLDEEEELESLDDPGSLSTPESSGSASSAPSFDDFDIPEMDGVELAPPPPEPELLASAIEISDDDLEIALNETSRTPPRDDSVDILEESIDDEILPDVASFSPEDFGLDDSAESPPRSGNEETIVDLGDFGLETEAESVQVAPSEDDFETLDMDLEFDDSIEAPLASSEEDISFDFDSLDEKMPEESFETVDEFDDFLSSVEEKTPSARNVTRPPETPKEEPLEEIDFDAIPEADITPTRRIRESAPVPESEDESMAMIENEEEEEEEDVLPELHLDTSAGKDDLGSAASGRDESFDDIDAFARDMSESGPSSSTSPDLLARIASELSGIKTELASLKRELASMKTGESGGIPATESHHEKGGGFFDEEEDETIALTGDELDNILNTADFTEENAEEDVGKPDIGDELILPEDGSTVEPPIEAIGGDFDAFSGDETLSAPDLEAISRLAETGVHPVTSPPEDTSYLEEASQKDGELLEIDDDFQAADDDVTGEIALDGEEFESAEPMEDLTLDVDAMEDSESGAADAMIEPIEELDTEILERPKPTAASRPVDIHPDDIRSTLDDDLFVTTPPVHEPVAQETRPKSAVVDKEPPDALKKDIKNVLTYLDKLLDSLPEDKIEEFARSEYFETYKKLFEELGLV